jgi:recombination protein RecA
MPAEHVWLGVEVSARRPAAWALGSLAGRFVEVSADAAGAPLTLAFCLVLEAQRRCEPVAWIGRREFPFFPPDVADAGIDLNALPVVWVPGHLEAARAADLLVRSGAFGLVVADLGPEARLPAAAQSRLAGLAKQHDTAVVVLTEKGVERPSLGSLVALRAHAARVGRDEGFYRCEARILKDKGRGPGWRHAEACRGPDGLR